MRVREIGIPLYVVLELVPLRGEINFKPCPKNRILVSLRGSFSKFPISTPVFFVWESPSSPPPPGVG